MDGCGYFKTMVKIMIPMAKPSILTVIMFNFLTFWNEYIIAYTLMDENGTLAMGLKNQMCIRDRGNIVEMGTFEELMKKKQFFYSLYTVNH